MKNIVLVFGFLSFIGFSQQNSKDQLWVQDFDTAKEIAKNDGKTILMYFTGSDWCMPCIMLKEDFFSTEKFKNYKDSYVFIKVDIPRNTDLLTPQQKSHNYKLLEEYNDQKSFPLVKIMSYKGKILDELSGYSSLRDPRYHFELLDKFSK
ncbi:thioredoxin family protein [Aquimarina pacifica]|uniref:thioredoxin family protein n=1 Tax=Aquimarina pacifica TaxID=1296415 RepID=UPI00046FE724|nr:thioredoxin family protein [Aquimarina pacifica]